MGSSSNSSSSSSGSSGSSGSSSSIIVCITIIMIIKKTLNLTIIWDESRIWNLLVGVPPIWGFSEVHK